MTIEGRKRLTGVRRKWPLVMTVAASRWRC